MQFAWFACAHCEGHEINRVNFNLGAQETADALVLSKKQSVGKVRRSCNICGAKRTMIFQVGPFIRPVMEMLENDMLGREADGMRSRGNLSLLYL